MTQAILPQPGDIRRVRVRPFEAPRCGHCGHTAGMGDSRINNRTVRVVKPLEKGHPVRCGYCGKPILLDEGYYLVMTTNERRPVKLALPYSWLEPEVINHALP